MELGGLGTWARLYNYSIIIHVSGCPPEDFSEIMRVN